MECHEGLGLGLHLGLVLVLVLVLGLGFGFGLGLGLGWVGCGSTKRSQKEFPTKGPNNYHTSGVASKIRTNHLVVHNLSSYHYIKSPLQERKASLKRCYYVEVVGELRYSGICQKS